MKYKYLYIAWVGMYLLCAALGFIPKPEGVVYWLLFFIGMMFFLPPAAILWKAIREKNAKQVKAVWWISIGWLSVMLILLVANFLSVGSAASVGLALYYLLVVMASPMVCSQIWVAPMFAFGCLLTASWQFLRKK